MGIGNEFIGNVEELLVSDVIRTKRLFRFSKEEHYSYTFLFETQVKEMFGSNAAIMFPSATTALDSFFRILKLKKNDEVIISPLSWVADYSTILFNNLKIKFCKFDENLQIDVNSIKKLINQKTKVVVIPHLMGRGQQKIEEIAKLCNKNGIILIEDIAQAFGVKVNRKYAGTFGDFAFTSLNHHKILSCGDGGVAIINNEKFVKKMLQIHDQGCFIDKSGNREILGKNYRKGLSFRVNNLTGATALAQLSKFFLLKNEILNVYNKFSNNISDEIKFEIIKEYEGDIPYTLLIKNKKTKNYPSLYESGWHFIENIPYFKNLKITESEKRNILDSKKILKNTYVYGAGFIDKYYAIKDGFSINDKVKKAKVRDLLDKK